jgi:poly(A) polymerase
MTRSIRKLQSLANQAWLNDPKLQAVLSVLNSAGETRVAGGAVRNALMGVEISDVDLATTVLPQDVMALAKAAGFGVHPTGIEHGTVTIINQGKPFEVTTLRRDIETDGRHAVVSFTQDFAEDAARRDFTMNALYCNSKGEIFDYTDGYADIIKRRVKFVGVPSQRIKEDYLRILRFFRFHAAYGKGSADAQGLAACQRLKSGLKNISAERIRQEFFKLLLAPRAVETLKIMAASGILKTLLPFNENWRLVKRLPLDAVLRIFAIANSPADLKEKLRLSNEEATRIESLIAAPQLSPKLMAKERRALLFMMGKGAWLDACALAHAQSPAALQNDNWLALRNLPNTWTIPTLPIGGKDLLAQGIPAGPKLGMLLQLAQDYWMAGDFLASREELLTYLESKIE